MSENKILFNTGSLDELSDEIGKLTSIEESRLKCRFRARKTGIDPD